MGFPRFTAGLLALIVILTLAPAAAAQSCAGMVQEIDGRDVNLVRMTEIDGVSLLGTYENEGRERPHVILRQGGEGVYEMHAQRLDDGIPVPIDWYVVANCDGTPFEVQRGDRGVRYMLAVQFGDSQLAGNYPPGSWRRYSLSIIPGDRRVIVNGDRIMKY
jgi:hypothetical protein